MVMGKIRHIDKDAAEKLTSAEWKADTTHLIDGVAGLEVTRSATLVVAASDSSALSKSMADYVCDGIDDNVQIQAAIDAIRVGTPSDATGGGVVLTEGNFYISSSITVAYGLTLSGQGMMATIIHLVDNSNVDMVVNPAAFTQFVNIKNLQLQGHKANQSSGRGIAFDNANKVCHSLIYNVMVNQTKDAGIYINRGYVHKVSHCFINDTDGDGIYIGANTENSAFVLYTFIDGVGGNGIDVRGGVTHRFFNNHIETTTGNSINIVTSHTEASKNYINAGNVGINASVSRNIISSNNIYNTTSHSIQIGGTTDGQIITENLIWASGAAGIYSTAMTHSIVVNNFITDASGIGIDINAGSDYNNIANNVITDPSILALGIYLSNADNNNVTDNVIRDTRVGVARKVNTGIRVNGGTNNTVKGNKVYNTVSYAYQTTDAQTVTDRAVESSSLDLSGGATDLDVFYAQDDCHLLGYTLLYTEASSADTGVDIRMGRYQDSVALDDNYFDNSTSEVSKDLGYSKTFVTADLTQTAIAGGDVLTVGTTGGKVGTGKVRVILYIAQ
jgi:hypothetical protein